MPAPAAGTAETPAKANSSLGSVALHPRCGSHQEELMMAARDPASQITSPETAALLSLPLQLPPSQVPTSKAPQKHPVPLP